MFNNEIALRLDTDINGIERSSMIKKKDMLCAKMVNKT